LAKKPGSKPKDQDLRAKRSAQPRRNSRAKGAKREVGAEIEAFDLEMTQLRDGLVAQQREDTARKAESIISRLLAIFS
jgi:hypothetical protein